MRSRKAFLKCFPGKLSKIKCPPHWPVLDMARVKPCRVRMPPGSGRGGRLRRRGGGGGTGALANALQVATEVAVAEQMCSGHCCTGAATVEGRWDSEVDRRWDRDRMYSSATQVDRDGTGIGYTAVQLTRLDLPFLLLLPANHLKPSNQIPTPPTKSLFVTNFSCL